MRFRHPDGSIVHLAYCTNVHPAEDAGRRRRRSWTGTPCRCGRRSASRVLGRRPVARPGAVAGLRPLRRALRAAAPPRWRPAAWRWSRSTASRTGPSTRRSSSGDVYLPDWTTVARLRVHAGLRPGAGRAAARRRRDGSDLDAAARPGGRRGTTRAGGPRPRAPRRAGRPSWRELGRDRPATSASGSSRSRAASSRRRAQAGALLADRRRERLGVCLDACHLAVAFEEPAAAVGRLAAAGLPVVKAQVSCALRVADAAPATRGRARRVRRAALPAPDARAPRRRVAGIDDLDEALGRRPAGRTALAGALPRPAARRAGGAADAAPELRGRRWRRSSAARAADAPPRGRDVHLEGAPAGPPARPTTPTWSTASPPSSPGRATGCVELGLEEVAREGPLLVLDVVGLTPAAARAHAAPRRARRPTGSRPSSAPCCPAVTCTVQSTFLTGAAARRARHRRQRLVLPRSWARSSSGGSTTRSCRARSSGRRPGARDPELPRGQRLLVVRDGRDDRHAPSRRGRSTTPTGASRRTATRVPAGAARRADRRRSATFPLFQYWGPTRGHRLVGVDRRRGRQRVMRRERPDLTLVYLPHLDYDLQRFGPDSAAGRGGRARARRGVGTAARRRRAPRASPSSCCPSTASPRRAGRSTSTGRCAARGLLDVYTQAGMEYLDPWTSRGVRRRRPPGRPRLRARSRPTCRPSRDAAARRLPGVAEVLDDDGQARSRPRPRALRRARARRRAGRVVHLLLLARRRGAPDFARTVEIHRKPGYDPAELFFDPADPRVKLKAGASPRCARSSACATR